jgi:chromosome segregation ATPase
VDTARATLAGTVAAALVALAGALLNRYGKRDDTATERARLADERRQKDIDTIIGTLQEEVASLRVVVRSHEETINTLRTQNFDLYGEKQTLAGELVRLRARVAQLEGKVS